MFENQWEVIKYIEDKFGNKLSYVSAPYQNANLPYFKDIDTGIEFVRVCQNVHILFLCTKPRLSQARALLFPKVFVPLGIKKISL